MLLISTLLAALSREFLATTFLSITNPSLEALRLLITAGVSNQAQKFKTLSTENIYLSFRLGFKDENAPSRRSCDVIRFEEHTINLPGSFGKHRNLSIGTTNFIQETLSTNSKGKDKSGYPKKDNEKPAEKAHMIFGQECKETKKNKTVLDKIQTRVENKPECVSRMEPVQPEPAEVVVQPKPEPKPACVEKPSEKPPLVIHICASETSKRDIFKKVVNEAIILEKIKKCCECPPKTTEKTSSSRNSSLARIERKLTSVLTVAMIGFLGYLTWAYGGLGGENSSQDGKVKK
ncbi:hypothetical protein WDU94_014616 [Cyamophila willieti]